jgi:ribosomal protein L39E
MAERRHNLPVQPTPLVGREREIQAARVKLLAPKVMLARLERRLPALTGAAQRRTLSHSGRRRHWREGAKSCRRRPGTPGAATSTSRIR